MAPENLAVFGRRSNQDFMTPIGLKTTRKRKENGKEKSGVEKRTRHTHNFNTADFGDSS